jgi:hypothetical protein
MIEKYNLPYGNYEATYYSITGGYAMIDFKFTEYGFTKSISFNTSDYKVKLTDYVSGKRGEVVTQEQLHTIVTLINEGKIYQNSDTDFLLKLMK